MAISGKSKTLLCKGEYQFCKICKRHHIDGRKHIYSKTHKAKVDVVLKNFGGKIHNARVLLHKPSVIDGELEPGAKMWCYCCELEINKHITDGNTSIQLGGVLEHISKADHHKKTRKFWWENGIDHSLLQKFILYEAEFDRFKSSVSVGLEKLELNRNKRTKQIADEIRQTELLQETIAREQLPKPLFMPSSSSQSSSDSLPSSSLSSSRGNIHTGAVPPWLIDDNQPNSNTVTIGPSEDEFLKWKEKNSKSGKNPKRVGADFHRNLKRLGLWDRDDDEWLPNFGRVWNAGPRSHSRKEFKTELSSSDASTSSLPSSLSVQPYVRRRPLKRPHPDSNDDK